MEKFECVFEYEHQNAEFGSLFGFVSAVEYGFGKFDEPIAEIAPHEVVKGGACKPYFKLFHISGNGSYRLI